MVFGSAGQSPAHAEVEETQQLRILVHSLADSGVGTLRQALIQANAAAAGTAVTIEFDILACHGPCSIRPATALPPIRHDQVTIDGYSQLGAREASGETPAQLMIELDGRDVTNNGLSIISAGNVVKGLSIHGFAWSGIAIGGPEARGNLISGNHIGLDPAGNSAPGNGFSGIYLAQGAHQNGVGGPVPAQRNVIAGNGWEGIGIHGPNTRENVVLGNYIGTDATGESARPNALDGVRVYGGAHDNRIGLLLDDVEPDSFGNLISGNRRDGVRIAGVGSDGNRLWANFIGTTRRGTVGLANGGHGVNVVDGAREAAIAGGLGAALCLISGNDGDGVRLDGADESVVRGCRIGTEASGGRALPNAGGGVHVAKAAAVSVGGDGSGEGNVISGNVGSGVVLSGTATTGVIVAGNLVGLNLSGNGAVPNQGDGIFIGGGANRNQVGSAPVAPETWLLVGPSRLTAATAAAPSARNVISANSGYGVRIVGAGTDENALNSNKIGTDADGTRPLGNARSGVFVAEGARRNLIGAGGPGSGNLISANQFGIAIFGAGTADTVVAGNQIGVEAGGVEPMGNLRSGIAIQDGARDSRIGPGNLIAHNGDQGVWVHGATTRGHRIVRSAIHDNRDDGIHLADGANGGIQPPVAEVWLSGSRTLVGRTCGRCFVEAFANRDEDGEGEQPLVTSRADVEGFFRLVLPAFEAPFLTLTATDDALGTSRFSAPFRLMTLIPTSTPSPTLTPSPMPSPTSSPAPSATATRTSTATPTLTATPTPSATRTALPSPTPRPTSTPSGVPPAPTATTTRSPTPRSTSTPTPTVRVTPSPVASPTASATGTPRPTATTAPGLTPGPTGTVEVTPTRPVVSTPEPAPVARIHLPLGLRGAAIASGGRSGAAR
jgi:titin